MYRTAADLTILERDHISYAYGCEQFPFIKHILVPDTVTALSVGQCHQFTERNGVCFFLRRDKEKVLADSFIENLMEWSKENNVFCRQSDTVIGESIRNNSERWRAVIDKLNMAKSARVVVTDRFHGVVFSIITHTPVIVFKSYDTKISAGVRWFQDLDWVYYAENMDLAEIERLLEHYCLHEEVPVTTYSNCGNLVIQAISEIAKKP